MEKHFIKTTIHEYITEIKYQGHKIPVEEIFFQENPHKNYYDRELLKHIDVFIDDDTFKKNPIQWVDVNKIVPTQKFLSKDNLDDVQDIKIGDNTGAYLVKYNDLYYVIDGHHRIANQIVEGVDNIKAYVQSVNNTNESLNKQTDNINDNFWKWFGDSKVVDKKGNPLIVYHGTDNKFNVFKKSKYGAMGSGIYLTTHKEIAEMHGKYIMELYVKIEKDSDGIIAGHEVIMKTPENIKSIHNDGTWDINDKNIYS